MNTINNATNIIGNLNIQIGKTRIYLNELRQFKCLLLSIQEAGD